ncbi:MAG TPA: anti-sigma factor [Cytophagales bacterium]|nr:anti-sigma factor [Cytophagales bacterium]HAA20368.1 anti-sigma factor [Cytophagales bacterium]HAP60868.1 anti-sigma factor [Cytophagales bacterium]
MQFDYMVPCSTNRLKEVRNFVNQVLHEYEFSEVDINRMVLAVDEVCSNLIIHSNNCNPEEMIELRINVDPEGIVFEIKDQGMAFKPDSYHEPSLREVIRKKKKGGIGLMLVKRIMDEIEFQSESSHNVCRLYKKI